MPLIARSSSSNMSQGPDSMDLVVSRYDESAYSVASYIGPILNMTPLSGLTTRVIIYSTGQDEPEDLRDDLRHHLPFNVDVIVRQRPNAHGNIEASDQVKSFPFNGRMQRSPEHFYRR
ncbi:hypothetical protein D6D08_09573 [Aureobasidium pullulans]|nr:hypothetical protein D6D08_09573 [Aureobasidium pullulans]